MYKNYKRTPDLLDEIKSSISILKNSGKTKLFVFDFDGTLVDTPLPEDGKPIWLEKTETEWPHKGWWGKKESLDLDIFNHPTIDSVIQEYNNVANDNDVMVVMLTGRMSKLHKEVKAILKSHNLEFDLHLLNTGGETSANKKKQISWLLDEVKSLEEIVMFDDRDEHIPVFQEFGDNLISEGRINNFKINHVLGEHHNKTP